MDQIETFELGSKYIVSNKSCQNLFCLPVKKVVDEHRKQQCRTVRNDLDCFKLSKWSDESPLMARPLRLLFYLGQLLSIHPPSPCINFTILYCTTYCTVLTIQYYDTHRSTQYHVEKYTVASSTLYPASMLYHTDIKDEPHRSDQIFIDFPVHISTLIQPSQSH